MPSKENFQIAIDFRSRFEKWTLFFLFRNAISKKKNVRKYVTLLQQTVNNRWGIEFETFVSLFNHELYALDQ